MKDSRKLFEQMLKLPSPWEVVEVKIDEIKQEIKVFIEYGSEKGVDTDTGEICSVYDRRERSWRHLDTMEYQTWIYCKLPRIKNSFGEHHFIPVDWSDQGLSHTKKFENKCIDTLLHTHCQKSAAALMRISDDKICGIMHRAVNRGLSKRDLAKNPITSISIDEKSYGRGQHYISVLTDATNGRVLDVALERSEPAASALLQKVFTTEQLAGVKTMCCDMWDNFMSALKKTALMPSLSMTSFIL
jgi:transposase